MDLSSLKGVDKLPVAKVRLEATAANAAAGTFTFCELWPTAKAVLEVLGKKVPALAFLVGILIGVGDSVCG